MNQRMCIVDFGDVIEETKQRGLLPFTFDSILLIGQYPDG